MQPDAVLLVMPAVHNATMRDAPCTHAHTAASCVVHVCQPAPVNLAIVVVILPPEGTPDSCYGLVERHKVRQRDAPITVTVCRPSSGSSVPGQLLQGTCVCTQAGPAPASLPRHLVL